MPKSFTKKFVKQVLYQAFSRNFNHPIYGKRIGRGVENNPVDIYADALCLRGTSIEDYEALLAHLIEKKLIEESLEKDYYKITRLGQSVMLECK